MFSTHDACTCEIISPDLDIASGSEGEVTKL